MKKTKSKNEQIPKVKVIDDEYLNHLENITPLEGFRDDEKIVKLIKDDQLGSLKQEVFCQLYCSSSELFANGTQSYIEAYNPERKGNWYKSAMASSSRLLSNVKILKRINELLEIRGLNDSFVDKQLELLITQNADFKSKVSAIKEYNALKARVIKKLALTDGDGKDVPYRIIIEK